MQQTQDRTGEVTEHAGISVQLRSLASGREWLSTPDDLQVAWAHEVPAALTLRPDEAPGGGHAFSAQ